MEEGERVGCSAVGIKTHHISKLQKLLEVKKKKKSRAGPAPDRPPAAAQLC